MKSHDDTGVRVRDLGEFELIHRLEGVLPEIVRSGTSVHLGIGDDAAMLDIPAGESLVVTSDAMIADIHFRLDWTDWRSLGHKLLAVNLSDIAAMGAKPVGALVTLGLTGDEPVGDVVDLYAGLGALAAQWNVVIVGGDIVRSPRGQVFDLTAFGSVQPERVIRRSGARVGDAIVVSGTLGASAAGMAMLESGDRTARTSELLIESHLRPQPRLALGQILHDHGVTSAMDLSDGLLGDLPKLLAASGFAGEIETALIPVAAAIRALFPERWLELATRGGEDYELLMTIPPVRFKLLRDKALELGSTLTTIGRIVEGNAGDVRLVDESGDSTIAANGAFDHFLPDR